MPVDLRRLLMLYSSLVLCSLALVSGFSPPSNKCCFPLRRYPVTSECRRQPPRYYTSYSHISNHRQSNFQKDSNFHLNVTQKKDVSSSILSLAVPALVTLAIDPLMSLTDTILVGRFTNMIMDNTGELITSSIPLASIGAASALLTFTFYLFNFLSTVVTPLVSQQRASGQMSKALQTSSQALSLALLLGLILCILLQLVATPVLHTIFSTDISMGSVGDSYAQTFVKIRALASPAIFIASAATGILRGYALDGKTSLVIVGSVNVLNFIFDLLLIPSYDISIYTYNIHWGFGLGPTGAAISTTTAEWISAIAFLGVLGGILPSADTPKNDDKNPTVPLLGRNQVILYDDTILSPKKTCIWPSLEIPSWIDVQPLIVASSSVFARSLVLQIILAGAAAMAARSGLTIDSSIVSSSSSIDSITIESTTSSAYIAAHQIALQLWFLCSFVCDALVAASQTLVADAIGRQDSVDTRNICRKVFLYSIILGVILGLILQLLSFQSNGDSSTDPSGFLMTFFTQDIPTQEALLPILGIVSAAQPLNSFVFAADGVLQGASEFRYQAGSMALSVAIAILTFVGLEYGHDGASNTLIHVWEGLITLQVIRGMTSLYKLVDKNGPIDLLGS